MTRSMTGFGRARAVRDGKDIAVEIRSVNGRYLDCGVRLPRALSHLEDRVKPYLQSRGVVRGKVDVSVQIERTDEAAVSVGLDTAYVEGYLAALRKLRDDYGLKDDITVMNVAKNAAVFRTTAQEPDADADWDSLGPVLAAATDAFLAAREREGASLSADLLAKLAAVRIEVEAIAGESAASVEHYRARLSERVRDALADNRVTPDESRLLTEVAVFADRVAIDEELVRLRTHFASFEAILAGSEPVGRKLDFLMQEMNREINTVGSKCNDAAIAARVVTVKCEFEKMREQIQNLE